MQKSGLSPTELQDEMAEVKEAQQLYKDQAEMLKRDQISRKESTDAYLQNKDRFAKEEKMFDNLTREDLKFLHEADVGILSNEQFREFTSKEGYASRKRQIFDELVGEPQKVGQTKVGKQQLSSMLRRTGSSRTIINPVLNGFKNHYETLKKGYRQIIYNKVNNLATTFPELFQKQQLIRSRMANGGFRYPQEKDPNIIMSRVNGKRVPYLVDNYIKTVLDEILTPANFEIVEQLILGISRMFTRGTTATFMQFAFTNTIVDQVTATGNTQNDYIPVYSAIKELVKALKDPASIEAQYLTEYLVLGGDRQTMVNWQGMSANELFKAVTKERKGILRAVDGINKGLEILSIPSKYSEIMTRATEYVKARKSGKSQVVALEDAGRVTAPFHHVGK